MFIPETTTTDTARTGRVGSKDLSVCNPGTLFLPLTPRYMKDQYFYFAIKGDTVGFPGLKFCSGGIETTTANGCVEWRISGCPIFFNGRFDGLALLTELSDLRAETPRQLFAKIEDRCKTLGLDFKATKEIQRPKNYYEK